MVRTDRAVPSCHPPLEISRRARIGNPRLRLSHGRTAAIVVCLAALFAIAPSRSGADCSQLDPLGPLPENGACAGWSRDGEARTAHTFEELAQIIDGAAGLHDQYGFVSAAFQNYVGEIAALSASVPKDQILPVGATLALFNQGTSENATGLYQDPSSGMGDPVPDWSCMGEARFRVAAGSTLVQFHEECFFGSIVVLASDSAALDGARCLAERACGLIQQAVPVRKEGWGALRALFR